jgi:hypothetical protein
MEKKKMTIVVVIVCLVVGFVLGYMVEEVVEDDDDDEGGTGPEVPYEPVIDSANFVDTVDNPYFPLVPGTELTYEADTEDGPEEIIVLVTNDTREILGITCTVVRDTVTVDGVLVEDTYDWYAQDTDGNVWYMGEDSKEYEDGDFVGTSGSWEAGVDGAYPGIIMLADPIVGISYRQEYYEGEAEDMGAVVGLGESTTVPYGSYDNVLVTMDWDPLEPDVTERKYYARDIGVILEVEKGGDNERVELVDVQTG